MNKSFISISSVIYNNKLIHLRASNGKAISNDRGLLFNECIDFLFNLVYERNKKSGVVFVCYAFSRDNEFIFSTMPKILKDKLFQSHTVKKDIDSIENELETIANDLYRQDENSQDFQQLDFEKYVLSLSLKELIEVKYNDYKITLRNGKILTINKNGKSISIYDIYGFFDKKTLRQSVNTWLKQDVALLDKELFITNPLYKDNEIEQLKVYSSLETEYIKKLAVKLNAELVNNDINLARYHGASAITSYWLNKYDFKGNFHNYRYARQLSPELGHAVMCAFFGGRAEQFKIGTLKEVNVYDINSAYAYATCFLPSLLNKPYFVEGWKNVKFGLFYCEYNFTANTNNSLYFGLLPYREINGLTKYKQSGRGWFWQPEISYILENYPNCINIKYGYVLDNESTPFRDVINHLYNVRLKLQAENNPLEKVIKQALASIYGKFCQHNGKGNYYNLFYAGFITSFVRRMLLEATKGNEEKTICFQTDAIHTTANLPLPVSGLLGEYKLSEYNKITYLDNGVYQANDNTRHIVKTKTRGFKNFDFDKSLNELQSNFSYTASANIFIGHNIFSLNQFGLKAEYLNIFDIKKNTNPLTENNMRNFESKEIDLLADYLDSNILTDDNGLDSASYKQNSYMNKQIIDSIEAMRI